MDSPSPYNRRNLELRAAEYYASIRKPENEWRTIEDLTPQLAEFEHRTIAKDYHLAFAMLAEIDELLFLWGHYTRLIDLREIFAACSVPPDLCAINLERLGKAKHYLGRYTEAIECFEKALADCRKTELQEEEGVILGHLGHSYRALGRTEEAIYSYLQALRIAQQTGDRRTEAQQLGRLGTYYHDQGRFRNAIEFYNKALAIARETGDHQQESFQLGNLGHAYRDLGYVDRSLKLHKEDLAITRRLGHRRAEGAVIAQIATCYQLLGQFERSSQLYKDSLAISTEVNEQRGQTAALGNMGEIFYALGKTELAVDFYERALKIARRIGNQRYESMQLNRLGNAYYALRKIVQAEEYYGESLDISRKIDYQVGKGYSLLGLGMTNLCNGNPIIARNYCLDVLALNIPMIGYVATLVCGIVALYQHYIADGSSTFTNAATQCQVLLKKAPRIYNPRYVLATALVGQVVCDPRWIDTDQRADLLAPALAEYRLALKITSAPGVVRDALRDLKLIRAVGIEGLEPVFALLEQALNADTPATEGSSDLGTE